MSREQGRGNGLMPCDTVTFTLGVLSLGWAVKLLPPPAPTPSQCRTRTWKVQRVRVLTKSLLAVAVLRGQAGCGG